MWGGHVKKDSLMIAEDVKIKGFVACSLYCKEKKWVNQDVIQDLRSSLISGEVGDAMFAEAGVYQMAFSNKLSHACDGCTYRFIKISGHYNQVSYCLASGHEGDKIIRMMLAEVMWV